MCVVLQNVEADVLDGSLSSPDRDSQHSIPDLLAEAIDDEEKEGTCQHVLSSYLLPRIENSAGGIEMVSIPCRRRLLCCALFKLNISFAIDPRLSKSKTWNLWKKKYFLLIFYHLGLPIRLIVLFVNSIFFKTL